MMFSDHFSARNYYHPNCYKLKPRFKHIDPETQIYNLDKVNKKDQNIALKQIKN